MSWLRFAGRIAAMVVLLFAVAVTPLYVVSTTRYYEPGRKVLSVAPWSIGQIVFNCVQMGTFLPLLASALYWGSPLFFTRQPVDVGCGGRRFVVVRLLSMRSRC